MPRTSLTIKIKTFSSYHFFFSYLSMSHKKTMEVKIEKTIGKIKISIYV